MTSSQPASPQPRKLGLQPFDRSMIQAFLEKNEMPFETDGDGDYSVTLRLAAEGQDGGLDIALFFIAGGNNDEVYTIRGTAAAPVPEEAWGPMVGACNQWNASAYFAKAYLLTQAESDGNPAVGRIIVDQNIPLDPGVSQLQLDEFTQQAINTIVSFWTWLAQEGILQFGTIPADDEAAVGSVDLSGTANDDASLN